MKHFYRTRQLYTFLVLIALMASLAACGKNDDPPIQEESRFQVEDRIAEALASVNLQNKAQVIESKNTKENVIALTFDGMNDTDVMQAVLNITTKYGIKATFFPQGAEVAGYSKIVSDIKRAGHEVGSYTLYGKSHMDVFSVEELIDDFVYSSVIMQEVTGIRPTLLKCRNTVYTDTLLAAAKASGFDYAVRTENNLSYQSFDSYQAAVNYLKRIPNGSIVSLKMRGVLEEGEYIPTLKKPEEEKKDDEPLKPSEDKTANVGNKDEYDQNERLLEVVEWLCKAISESGREVIFVKDLPDEEESDEESYSRPYRPVSGGGRTGERAPEKQRDSAKEQNPAQDREMLENLREANKGALAKDLNEIYTVQRAAAFVFYGVTNENALRHTLTRLEELDISGTFFVSYEDVENYPERIESIIKGGNEIGVAVLPKNGADFYTAAAAIKKTVDILESQYKITPTLAKQPFSALTDETREAVSSMGLTLVSHSVAMVRTDDEYEVSADNIIQRVYTGGKDSVERGEIVYFRMDFYKASDNLIGDLVKRFKEVYVDPIRYEGDTQGIYAYDIKGVGEMLAATQYQYEYPLKDSSVIPKSLNAIHPGYLDGLSDDEIFDIIQEGYIGSPSVAVERMLPGFTPEQVAALDHEGVIDTGGENIIFLSFDDWGTDKSVNHLLYVLKKHDIKATFFIRTNYVANNPNLLRAIAVEGHELASHTHNHYTLSNYDEKTGLYSSLSEEQVEQLEDELVISYNTLISIAGDLKNEKGDPVVARHFRAPTLAQSYAGMKAVFDCGYKYSISGDFSTGDYQIGSASELYDYFETGMPFGERTLYIQPGSNVVMHMSSESEYTALALDMYFINNAQKPPEERYTSVRISDYLEP